MKTNKWNGRERWGERERERRRRRSLSDAGEFTLRTQSLDCIIIRIPFFTLVNQIAILRRERKKKRKIGSEKQYLYTRYKKNKKK